MQVNPESRALDGISTLLTFIALNVIYLVTCIPILTIGVATSALYEVTMRFADDERGNLIRDYFSALRVNFLPATAVYLVLGVPVAVLGFGAAFWSAYDSPVSLAATILAAIAAVYLFISLQWGLAQVAGYTNSIGQTLKNSLLLTGAEMLRSLGILLIPVTMVGLTVIMPVFVWVLATIGFSVGSYLTAFLFRGAFARHSPS